MSEKQFFYATFGQAHAHRFNGHTLDKDIVLAVKAIDYEHAYKWLNEMFERNWSMLYNSCSEVDLSYYPRGIIEVEI